jgi:SAM-dependent methyltransferase
VALAENSGLENESVDLITVATALHWFDQQKFYAEADRVLKPGGILAVWSYAGTHATPEIQKIHDTFAFETLLDYWSEGAKRNWMDRYRNVKLPFHTVSAPSFRAREHWTIDQLIEYLNSWSSVQAYKDAHGVNPVDEIHPQLVEAWGAERTHELTWDLMLMVSKKARLTS